MTKTKSIEQLKSKMGKSWMYKTKVYRFESLNISDTEITIAASPGWISIKPDVLDTFLDDLLPVDDKPATIAPSRIQSKILDENASDLISLMKDNIEKVKNDPSYAKQAKEVTSAAKVIVDIAKLELEAYKQMGKAQ